MFLSFATLFLDKAGMDFFLQIVLVGHPRLPVLDVTPLDPRQGVLHFQKQLTAAIIDARDLAALNNLIKQHEGEHWYQYWQTRAEQR